MALRERLRIGFWPAMSAMSRAIDKCHELFEMYPVLLYPSRIYDHGAGRGEPQGQLRAPRPADRVPGTDFGMFFDLGVYGVPKAIKEKRPGSRFYLQATRFGASPRSSRP